MRADTILREATLVNGHMVDVVLRDGLIAAVQPSGALPDWFADAEHDLRGYVLLPALAEPHTHLDKALTAGRFDREFTELLAAVEAWHGLRSSLSVDDMIERARRAALLALDHGVTAIRSHADVGQGIGLRAVEALIAVRDELRDLIDIQVVALCYPLTGAVGRDNTRLLREALELGADVVGGAPHVDADPARHVGVCLEIASEYQRPVDLHADENLRSDSIDLVELVRQVGTGFPYRVTASHCVSLGVQSREDQLKLAEGAAQAGVSVITCPIANLYLQARDRPTSTPRGLTALASLLQSGVVVAGGGDNIQDPFIPVGRADPLVVAQYLVVGGQLALDDAYVLVGPAARDVMGLESIEIAPGFQADLVAIESHSLQEAIATVSEDRMVFRAGRLVSRSKLVRASQIDRAEQRQRW